MVTAIIIYPLKLIIVYVWDLCLDSQPFGSEEGPLHSDGASPMHNDNPIRCTTDGHRVCNNVLLQGRAWHSLHLESRLDGSSNGRRRDCQLAQL